MRSTEVQRKLTCSSSSLATVPMAASSPTVGAVDQQLCVKEDAMGTFASVLVVTLGHGHRAGLAGPPPAQCSTRSPNRERTQTKLEIDNRESTATTDVPSEIAR